MNAEQPPTRHWPTHLGAGILLALFVGILYYPLIFTNRVLATGDILLYFYPYRDFVAAALRSGQLPFWNPYLFAGAPLLANPQAAVLYPLHWPLIWLPATQQVYWSAAVHTWLLGYGGYWLLRRWRYGAWAGMVTGVVLAGAGFVGGMAGHLNQLNGVAWLPWSVLCVEGQAVSGVRPGAHRTGVFVAARSAALGVVVALMLLAGHTQTVYINLTGLGVWVVWPALGVLWRWLRTRPRWLSGWAAWREFPKQFFRRVRQSRQIVPRLIIYVAGVLLGVLLSAPQLLPTLELSGLGLRTGGLSYLEATSFSLKPLALGWTLLPSYGLVSLESVFDTPAYTEFVAFVGLVGLVLALVGAWKGRGPARTFGILFALLGLLLAFGRWNPLYFVLHQFVPGFDLFRAPARWMMLYTLGMAVLAGVGCDHLIGGQRQGAGRAWPKLKPARRRTLAAALLAAVALDLLLAARALPYTRPTAPEAVDGVRTAPAHLLTDPARATAGAAAAGRFLGLSTITYDPGDMPDYRRILVESTPPSLSPAAFEDLVIAQKVQELLAPNLALYWRIPALDGFDGGVLPLRRFNQFAGLLIPADDYVPDGRLREQLQDVPPASVLNLANVQYLITDKVRDLWFEDVYYDRQIGARLEATHLPMQIETPADFSATHLDLIAYVDAGAAAVDELRATAKPVASVTVTDSFGVAEQFTVTAGGAPGAQLADGALGSVLAATSGANVAYQDVEGGRQEYRVRLPFSGPLVAAGISVRALDQRFPVVVQAATLVDARTHMLSALLPSDRGRFARVHSGDVKIYENLDLRPRAYLATTTLAAASPEQALALLQGRPGPAPAVVVEGMAPLTSTATTTGTVEVVSYAPERVELRTASAEPALLVLTDAYYPGWQATVDGAPAAIYPANVLFRGVPVPAGDHRVVFTFQPTGWMLGLWLCVLGGVLVVAGFAAAVWQRVRQRHGTAV